MCNVGGFEHALFHFWWQIPFSLRNSVNLKQCQLSSQVRRDSEINHKTICLQIDPKKGDNISKDGECETVIFN